MHALPRNRVWTRLLGCNHNHRTRWRVDYCIMVGGILLLGSVALMYDAIVGKFSSNEIQRLNVDRGEFLQVLGDGEVGQEKGEESREDSSTGLFSSDGEPADEETRIRMEKTADIEDMLMQRDASHKKESWGRIQDGQSPKKEGRAGAKEAFDHLNPQNNPILQDPDATGGGGGGGLTKTDWPLKSFSETNVGPQKELDARVGNLKVDTHSIAQWRSLHGDSQMAKSELEVGMRKQGSERPKSQAHRLNLAAEWMRWADFPGLHPQLTFSGFMEEFLVDNKCSLKFFTVWMTPPWSFTMRHKRMLESILHFHPKACVVVFSETIDLQFFKSFVKDGYRVAVVMPNFDELLEDTPTANFAKIWIQWRKVDLYYIHCTDLLRLNALYKYGGIYLDWDMIVLKPLTGLRNTIGMEELANGQIHPNGAIMVFEKFSSFLYKSMEEFRATYIETLRDWDGAALLHRVMNVTFNSSDVKLAISDEFHLEPPISFFPLTSTSICSHFKAPENDEAVARQEALSTKILSKSFAVHLWNELTYNLIPEPGSLVKKLLDRNCIHCTDIL